MSTFLAFLLTMAQGSATPPAEPVVRYSFTVAAPPAAVWEAWSTDAGLRTFFAPAARIELRTFGRFDIHFDPAAAAGNQGAEGNVVLAVEPGRMLTTTWDAPPEFPSIRSQRTFLQVLLAPNADGTTRVTLTQSGFGTNPEWLKVHRYFLGAWSFVAAALQQRFETGPLNWSHMPNLLPKMKAIGGDAAVSWATAKQQ
jgi:uncharacterized protein YndB with AHSA1/START domain